MIVDGNPQRRRDLHDRLRHLDVGRGWCRIAGGVVVHHSPCYRQLYDIIVFLAIPVAVSVDVWGMFAVPDRDSSRLIIDMLIEPL